MSRVAFVHSCWHRDLVERCRDAFLEAIDESDLDVEVFEVPGAFELPYEVQRLAATADFDAVVAAGLVVDGGIYRHEFVAHAVISGLMKVQLESRVPVVSAVLTPQRFHEHEDHYRFFEEHLAGKGREAATACVHILDTLKTASEGPKRAAHGPDHDHNRFAEFRYVVATPRFDATVEFYERHLGMTRRYSWDEAESSGVLLRAGSTAHIEVLGPPAGASEQLTQPRSSEDQDGAPVFLALEVADVDACHDELRTADVDVVMPPTDMSWPQRLMSLRDPAGNLVNLFTRLAPPEDAE